VVLGCSGRSQADSVGILSHTYAGVKPHSQARRDSTCCGCGLEKPSAGLEVFLSAGQEEKPGLSDKGAILRMSRKFSCQGVTGLSLGEATSPGALWLKSIDPREALGTQTLGNLVSPCGVTVTILPHSHRISFPHFVSSLEGRLPWSHHCLRLPVLEAQCLLPHLLLFLSLEVPV
jgi:hypothetical protein